VEVITDFQNKIIFASELINRNCTTQFMFFYNTVNQVQLDKHYRSWHSSTLTQGGYDICLMSDDNGMQYNYYDM